MDNQFSLKQLGDLSYFLGIEVNRPTSQSLFLTQTKYTLDLLTVNEVCQFMQSTFLSHWKAECILCYLIGTQDYGVQLCASSIFMHLWLLRRR